MLTACNVYRVYAQACRADRLTSLCNVQVSIHLHGRWSQKLKTLQIMPFWNTINAPWITDLCLNWSLLVGHFFRLVCTLLLRKTKSKYRSVHNERITKRNKSISAKKKIQENVFLLNWKAHAKIQALLKAKKFYPKKSLTTVLHQAIPFQTQNL